MWGLSSEAKSRICELSQPAARRRAERAYVQTLASIDNKIRGWGDGNTQRPPETGVETC